MTDSNKKETIKQKVVDIANAAEANAKAHEENAKARDQVLEDYHSLNARRRARVLLVFAGMLLAFAVMVVVNINSGNVHISMSEIVWTIRMPRIIVSLLLGGALAMAGFLLQTFFENPIAGPYVLGISSGAKMVVAFVLIFFLQNAKHVSSFTVIAAAFVGSLLATLFILAVSQRIRNMAALLVAGIMVGYICNAVTEFMITFAEDSDIANLHGWSQGSFSGMTWTNVGICLVVVGAGFILTMILSKPIGAYQMGEVYAQSLGVNIKLFRAALILLSSLLSACVTAFAGPISFVGIAVPFLVKGVMGTSKPLVIIPGCMLGGGVFCMVCDLIARLAFAPIELNISTVTAVFGAPVVIYMMISRRRMR